MAILLIPHKSKCGRALAPDGGLGADQDAGLERVHICFCGNGCYGFRFYSGSLLKSAKVSKTLLPLGTSLMLGVPKIKSRSRSISRAARFASWFGVGVTPSPGVRVVSCAFIGDEQPLH